MPKTIGKDKASLSRARAARAEAEPVGDRTNDEPRDEDMLDAGGDGDLALAVATKAPAATADEEADEEDDTSLVLSGDAGARARGMPTQATRRGMHTPGWMMGNGFTRPIAEAIEELLKVTWPTWSEAWTMTLVVIAMSAVVAAILGVADIGLIRALSWIVSLGTATPSTH
ncbi:MAG: preprotein translocase subunit SecE [Ktedonobacterales bacterium]